MTTNPEKSNDNEELQNVEDTMPDFTIGDDYSQDVDLDTVDQNVDQKEQEEPEESDDAQLDDEIEDELEELDDETDEQEEEMPEAKIPETKPEPKAHKYELPPPLTPEQIEQRQSQPKEIPLEKVVEKALTNPEITFTFQKIIEQTIMDEMNFNKNLTPEERIKKQLDLMRVREQMVKTQNHIVEQQKQIKLFRQQKREEIKTQSRYIDNDTVADMVLNYTSQLNKQPEYSHYNQEQIQRLAIAKVENIFKNARYGDKHKNSVKARATQLSKTKKQPSEAAKKRSDLQREINAIKKDPNRVAFARMMGRTIEQQARENLDISK